MKYLMAHSGKKVIFLDIENPEDIDRFIKLAEKRGTGVRMSFQYSKGGLEITMVGPRDKLNLLEKVLREDWRNFYDNPI
jgi:hypothetical protein